MYTVQYRYLELKVHNAGTGTSDIIHYFSAEFVSHQGKYFLQKFYKKKQWRPLSKKRKRGKNVSPRNKKALPQRQHCPLAKCRRERSPMNHEEQEKYVA
jgi:hypothetical protein